MSLKNRTRSLLFNYMESVAGPYSRTMTFVQDYNGRDNRVRYEAIQNPVTRHWAVQKVTNRPNRLSQGSDRIEEYEPIKGMQNTDLVGAIQALAAFEHDLLKQGLSPHEKPEKKKGAQSHIIAFAKANGYDVAPEKNKHVMRDGVIIKAVRNDSDNQGKNTTPRRALAGMFRDIAVTDADLATLEDMKASLTQWKDFHNAAQDVRQILDTVQAYDYAEKTDEGFLFTKTYVRDEKIFFDKLAASRKKLSAIRNFPGDDGAAYYRDFLNRIELSYYVGLALCRFQENQWDDPDVDEKDVRRYMKQAVKFARHINLPAQELAALETQLAKPEPRKVVLPRRVYYMAPALDEGSDKIRQTLDGLQEGIKAREGHIGKAAQTSAAQKPAKPQP